VLGSGRGSNFFALADALARGSIPATVALVLSDVPNAGILQHARDRGVPCAHVPPGSFRTKLDEPAEADFLRRLQDAGTEMVILAGFMRVLKAPFLRAFPDRVLNIHPSLLPSFPGLRAWQQALDHGVKVTGCTVHLVDDGIDSGPILGQAAVPVLDSDTADSLHARIQNAERRLYPAVIDAFVRGHIRLDGRRSRGFIGLPAETPS
jgi:phosphoribosylglycinamide formyltransferase-1